MKEASMMGAKGLGDVFKRRKDESNFFQNNCGRTHQFFESQTQVLAGILGQMWLKMPVNAWV
jgi:hypothetical protein